MSRSGSMILCYHRVASEAEDPFKLCVTPQNFAAHLDEIVRHGEPSTLDQIALPSRRPRVVVTLDDGYADNLTNALPIAESRGVPITVFVTSGQVDGEQGLWWDRLGSLLGSRPSGIDEINLPLADGPVRIALGSPDDLGSVRSQLLPLPVTEIHRILDEVSQEWGTPASPTPGARTLTSSELLRLADSELVTIGAHTVDHVRLSNLPAQEQEKNISSSKEALEGLIGRPVTHFAYPFGGSDSFNESSVDAVRSSGFETACTTIPANARSTSNPFLLPRRMIMNWSGRRFRVSWERWKLLTRR
jgi:peptidoglycan/xylan/chitin deacetylase (PgdA/CDA1 family)